MLESRFVSRVVLVIATALPAVGALLAGMLVQMAAPLYRRHSHEIFHGKPLPALTEAVLSVTEAVPPSLLGTIFGIVIAMVAVYLVKTAADTSSAWRALLCCATLAWGIIALLFATTFLAFMLPLVTLYTMIQGS